MFFAQINHAHGRHHIVLRVADGIGDGHGDGRLRRQMNHGVKVVLFEHFRGLRGVQVETVINGGVVSIFRIFAVNHDDVAFFGDQFIHGVGSDEACSARNQYPHFFVLLF